MKQWLKYPHLPTGKVCLCAADISNPKLADSLKSLGIQCAPIAPCKALSSPVASHGDMVIHHLGGNRFFLAQGQEGLKSLLEEKEAQVQMYKIKGEKYPLDAALNGAAIGHCLVYNPKTLLQEIVWHYTKQNMRLLPVKQGYTKCAVAILNARAIITADQGIASVCRTAGFDVLQVAPGGIGIKEYEYGFIGGCCGLITPNAMAFSGDISQHPQYREINTFLQKHHIEAICLTKGPLWDIGGILPLQEEI